MKSTVIQIPDPLTTKSITFEQYKSIMAVYYMGALSIGRTDAAFFAMLNGVQPPACISAAFTAWRNSHAKPVFANTIKKNEAADSLYEVLKKIGTVTLDEICKKSGLGKNAVRTYLTLLIEGNCVTRTLKQQKFYYAAVPQKQEENEKLEEQVAA